MCHTTYKAHVIAKQSTLALLVLAMEEPHAVSLIFSKKSVDGSRDCDAGIGIQSKRSQKRLIWSSRKRRTQAKGLRPILAYGLEKTMGVPSVYQPRRLIPIPLPSHPQILEFGSAFGFGFEPETQLAYMSQIPGQTRWPYRCPPE
jgi:hypothetical protein